MNQSAYVVDVTKENFKETVVDPSMQCAVVVDFWAPWCGPCKTLTPLLEKLAEQYAGGFVLAKVNVDENQELAAYFGARSIPTIKIIKNGELVDEFVGAQPESVIRELLDRHIGPTTAEPSPVPTLDADDLDAAIAALEAQLETDPENSKIRKELVILRFQQGDYPATEREINALPAADQEADEIKAVQATLFFAKVVEDAPDIPTLTKNLADNPAATQSRFQLAAHNALAGDFAQALELLLTIVRKDRGFDDDAGRKAMVLIFDILGSADPLVGEYRRKLLNALH